MDREPDVVQKVGHMLGVNMDAGSLVTHYVPLATRAKGGCFENNRFKSVLENR